MVFEPALLNVMAHSTNQAMLAEIMTRDKVRVLSSWPVLIVPNVEGKPPLHGSDGWTRHTPAAVGLSAWLERAAKLKSFA